MSAQTTWKFINQCVICHVNREWYSKVNQSDVASLIEPKDHPSP